MVHVCTVCGKLASNGRRCAAHPKASGPSHPVHADPRWTRLSRRMMARHVGQFGRVCPGDGHDHPAHPSGDLTLDHVIPLAEGGAAFDPANTRVLCRSRNSANGARLANDRRAGRVAPRVPVVRNERATIRARYLG